MSRLFSLVTIRSSRSVVHYQRILRRQRSFSHEKSHSPQFFLAIASSSILPFDTLPLQAGRTGSLRGTLQQKYLLKTSISSQSWQQCWLPCRQDVEPASGRNPARIKLCRQMTLGVQEGKIMRRLRRVTTKIGFWEESPLERSPTEGDASIP